jgi:hypothetical protein
MRTGQVTKITESISKEISALVALTPGWSPVDQLIALFDLVCEVSELKGDVVEVGSWCGRSASVLGLAAQNAGDTKVYCVDLFPDRMDWRKNPDGTYYFEVILDGVPLRGCQHQTVWKEVFEQQIEPVYEQYGSVRRAFELRMRASGLENVVKPYRGDSTSFIKSVPRGFSCKLAFIDGEHSYEAVCKDIRNIESVLIPGGWLCFDDAFSEYEGVDRAIEELIIGNDLFGGCKQVTRKLFIAQKIGTGGRLTHNRDAINSEA